MSLKRHLEQGQSPVRRFFDEHFPNTRPLLKECHSQLKAARTLRPPVDVAWTTVGTALDYRIRYYFGVTPPEELAAWKGAHQPPVVVPPPGMDPWEFVDSLPEDTLPSAQPDGYAFYVLPEDIRPPSVQPGVYAVYAVEEFFAELSQVLAEVNPVGRRLDDYQESRLVRYCYVLALFEDLYRDPDLRRVFNSPLYTPPKRTVAELLAIPPPAAVEDLCALSYGFYDSFSQWLTRPAILNPTFDGSEEIGGADADLILDGCLIEIKTTVKAQVESLWFYQLLGYVFLDYTDRYHISQVGIYMARQRTFLCWPLDKLIHTLTGGKGPDLRQLRVRFRRAVRACSR